jgi:hypothetical protein
MARFSCSCLYAAFNPVSGPDEPVSNTGSDCPFFFTALGYKPKTAMPAYVTLDVFQVVPAIGSGANVIPDYNYALSIQPGMRVKPASGNTSIFRTLDSINFAYSSSYDTTDVTIYDVDPSTKTPTYFLLKKKIFIFI